MVKSNVLEMMPSKTARRTSKKVVAPLREYPMVVEELAHAVHADRCGPTIVHLQTGAPYSRGQWLGLWHDVCELVGIDRTEELEPRPARQRHHRGRRGRTSKIRLCKPVTTRRQLSGTTSAAIGRWCGLRKNVAPTAQSTIGNNP